jgi:hypothetical protein
VGVLGQATGTNFAGVFQGDVVIFGKLIVSELNVMGAKSAIVPFPSGSHHRMYCVESPESWFEDFGQAELTAGKATVMIDPDFACVICGSYHVFLTPYGDSQGLFVHDRGSKSFEVHEQKGGTSNLTFSYRVIAPRKDIEGQRFERVKLPSPDLAKLRLPEE